MRRSIVLAAALVVTGAAPAATARPALHILETTPLTVRGVHFRPAEHVRVTTILSGERHLRTATAGSAGTFLVRFRAVEPGPCNAYRIVALGDRGSRANLMVQPACAAP